MRGKAQPDGRPALQIIETPFLLFAIPFRYLWTKVHVQRRFPINIYEKPAWWPFVRVVFCPVVFCPGFISESRPHYTDRISRDPHTRCAVTSSVTWQRQYRTLCELRYERPKKSIE